jgi:hypothetical protein
MALPLNALLERSGNPAIGAYENLRLVQDSNSSSFDPSFFFAGIDSI